MNLKYILIIVILTAFVGGGVLTYQYWWMPRQEIKSPEVKPQEEVTTDETANWKTYRNEEHGYELKYPSEVVLIPRAEDDKAFFYLKTHNLLNTETFVPAITINKYSKETNISLSTWLDLNVAVDSDTTKLYSGVVSVKKIIRGEDEFLCFLAHSGPTAFARHCLIDQGGDVYDILIRLPGSGENGPNEKLLETYDQMLSTFRFLE